MFSTFSLSSFYFSFVSAAGEAGFKDEEEAVQHLLLFVSALIPKALSSLLASFCLAMAGSDKVLLFHLKIVKKN